jgi:rhamnose utilization protein RhaD (predicted bifunctional aldolase and dehydrogenase)
VPEEQQAAVTPVEPVAPQPVAESSDLAAQLEALRAKNQELIAERRKDRENRESLQQQIEDLRQAQESAKTAKLAESGEFKTLWEEAQQTVAALKQQLAEKESEVEQVRQGYSQEQLRAGAIAQLSSAGALAPDQLYRLVQENLRAKEGQPVAYVGGVEVPIGEYIANLKNPGSGYEHHFAATNRAGMGVTGSARATALPGQSNPWLKDSWNVTQQMILLSKDPDKARLLKAEAGIN